MLWTEHRQSLRRGEEKKNEKKNGGKEGQTGRKACPLYQNKLRKIKPNRGPRFLSGDVSGPFNKNPSRVNIQEEL